MLALTRLRRGRGRNGTMAAAAARAGVSDGEELELSEMTLFQMVLICSFGGALLMLSMVFLDDAAMRITGASENQIKKPNVRSKKRRNKKEN